MIAQTIITFLRGLILTFPVIVIGILIARYVPSSMIAGGTGVLLLVVIFIAGSLLDTPRQLWRKLFSNDSPTKKQWWEKRD